VRFCDAPVLSLGKDWGGGSFLRVFVVDDEKPCLDELVYMLTQQEDMEIVGAFTSSLKALEAVVNIKPAAAFIDLSMPYMNGSELARNMVTYNHDMKIVFVTAYRKELAKLRGSIAVYSLLKPVNEVKLQELLRRLRR